MTNDKNKKTIILTGGGTGGHVLPLIEVAKSLGSKPESDFEFIYFGSGNKLEVELARKNSFYYQRILTGKFRRNFSLISFLQNIADLFKLILGSIQAVIILAKLKPDLIFSKGGYVSLPTVLAGAFWQIPIIVHESDIVPGLANRIGIRFARRIGLGFPLLAYPKKYYEKGFYCGIPLRKEFFELWQKPVRKGNYLLVFGGSSGAQSLNDKVFAVGREILETENIIHITGNDDITRARQFRKTLPSKLAKRYECYGFIDDMPTVIYRSSAVVTRAGATAIAEVGACRKKALLVPLSKVVGTHQSANAVFIKKNNLVQFLPNDSSDKKFLQSVNKLLDQKEDGKLEQFYFPYSADVLNRVVRDELEATKLRKTRRFFLIGICGVSMAGVAKVLRSLGKEIMGSDLKLGGHSAQNISKNLDGVVYSSAANRNGLAKSEFEQAQKFEIPLIKRSRMIGMLMNGKKGITVSGMHGKTTISSIIARIFEQQYPGTSYLIGAPDSIANNVAESGDGGYFVAEACEYDSSFLDLPSEIAVISNIEKEHLDYFKDLNRIIEEFGKYIDNIYPGGALIYCADDEITYNLVKKKFDCLEAKRIKVVSYGFKSTADISIKNYKVKDGKVSFSLHIVNGRTIELEVVVPGKHFALNCAAAACVSLNCGIDDLTILEVISSFSGASRRFEKIGEKKKTVVYDDYGHHPTEILATTRAFAEFFPDRYKVLVYQPHQQSRFNELFSEFMESFLLAPVDKIVILPVYRVEGRDQKPLFTTGDLVSKINEAKQDKAISLNGYEQATEFLESLQNERAAIMTMGATDVWKVGSNYLNKG